MSVKSAHSATVPTGMVITQKPDKGSGEAGDKVSLTRSLGPVMVTVPNVTRMGVMAATEAVEEAGFRVEVKPVLVNYLALGYVAYSKPGARGKAPQGSTITLYPV